MNAPVLLRMRAWLAAISVVGSASLVAAPLFSAVAPIHPKVLEATRDVVSSRGPARYSALRQLWSLWDDTDPQHIEQALRDLQSSPQLDHPTRSYAALLSAYARRRRGDLQGARKQIRSLGYVKDWLVIGPFDNEGRSGLDQVFGPETMLSDPLDTQKAYQGKEGPVRWRTVPDVYPYGWLDFGDLLRPEEQVCGYATTFVRSRGGTAQSATVWVGTTGGFRLFFNGQEVLKDPLYRHLDADRFATTVQVNPGWNRLTVKVCGDSLSPMLTLRLGDTWGAPDVSLETSSDAAHGESAAKNAVKPEVSPARAQRVVLLAKGTEGSVRASGAPRIRERDPGRVLGAIHQFEQDLKGQINSADLLEAYAIYLVRTGGDDQSKHLARDFATRAADQSPTIDRLLLAASLAEDRNQQRIRIEKAARLAGDKRNIGLLLAQAQLARSGPNWRDAVPFYDEALRLEPDRLEALLGRVDLYNEAGLRRTALGMLEQAVARNPRAVGLLRVYAPQLASLGRHAEAGTISARYEAYRFDDPTSQVARIETAVAQRNDALAQHWIRRLLEADPDSSFHLGVAARAYLSMGKPRRAIASYEKALAMAPEDTDTMRELANLHGQLGERDQQLRLLRQVLKLKPQFKDVREYVEHIEPKQPRADEAYAWSAEQFLPLRTAPAEGFNNRKLRDLHVTTVYPSGLSSTFHQVVFQPLTDEAAASAREYAFAYQADRQVVQLRAGRVYRADGHIDETIKTSEGPADNPAIAMYTSARMYYVQFPRLDVGDVVELRYRIEEVSPNNVFADYFGEVRYMQSSEPMRNVEYVVIAPTSRKLQFGVSIPGIRREDRVNGSTTVHRFFAAKVAPILPEPDMPPWSEVLGHVHVSTYKDWKDVGKWYWGLAKEQINPDDEVRRKALELARGLKTDEEKVRAIYGWVVKRTRYVALEFGIYGYKPRRASQTFARGWGDCKDKATLIVSMLDVVGIPANLVIVRTALRGSFPAEPASLAPFDHAIAYVPSLDLYLDGTAEYTGSKEFPAFDRDGLGVVVRPDNSQLVRLPNPPAADTSRTKKLQATLRPDGSAGVSMDFDTSGAIAAQWRLRYHGEDTRRDRIAADIAQALPGFVLAGGKAGLEVNNLEDIEQSVRLKVRGSSPRFARRQGRDLSVPVTPQDRFVSQFATLSQRKLDLVLPYRSSIDETWTVTLPAGQKVRESPKGTQIATPFGSMTLDVRQNGMIVEVRTRVNFDKKRIKPSEYAAFATFCEQIDRAVNQRLIVGS